MKYQAIKIMVAVLLLLSLALGNRISAQDVSQGNVLFVNYIGQDLLLDLNDTQYTIPGTSRQPEGGRLSLQLPVGEYRFAANVPGIPIGQAGEFRIEDGNSRIAKAARISQTEPRVDNGIVIEEPKDRVFLFDFNPDAPAATPTPLLDTWTPQPPASGQGSLVWLNHGGADEVTLDFNGQTYRVPIQQNGIPGRFQLDVPPGTHRYNLTVPNGGTGGEVSVARGQLVGLDIFVDRAPLVYEEGEAFNPLPPATLTVQTALLTLTPTPTVTAPLTLTATTTAPLTPTLTPTVTSTVAATPLAMPQPSITVKNYAGGPLTFTIANQSHTIANQAALTLPLSNALYTYTASRPGLATSGSLDLTSSTTHTLSVALDFTANTLSVYRE